MNQLKISVSFDERPGSCVITSEARYDAWPAMVDETRVELHAPLDRDVHKAVDQIIDRFLEGS